MNLRFTLFITIFTLIIWSIFSCSKSTEIKISKHNDRESHHNGRNCMDCHNAGGQGNGIWAVAGSCYDSLFTNPYANATVKFFTEANGAGMEVASLEVDGKGNFYTTESIKFGLGLYPVVIGTTGKKMAMQNIVTSGACGSCHNYTTCKICVK